MSRRRVVVTGLGLVSPVGNNTADSWRSVRDGISGITLIDTFDTEGFASRIGGLIKDFDVSPYLDAKHARNSDQFMHYGVASSKQAFEDAGRRFRKAKRIGSGSLWDRVSADSGRSKKTTSVI